MRRARGGEKDMGRVGRWCDFDAAVKSDVQVLRRITKYVMI